MQLYSLSKNDCHGSWFRILASISVSTTLQHNLFQYMALCFTYCNYCNIWHIASYIDTLNLQYMRWSSTKTIISGQCFIYCNILFCITNRIPGTHFQFRVIGVVIMIDILLLFFASTDHWSSRSNCALHCFMYPLFRSFCNLFHVISPVWIGNRSTSWEIL